MTRYSDRKTKQGAKDPQRERGPGLRDVWPGAAAQGVGRRKGRRCPSQWFHLGVLWTDGPPPAPPPSPWTSPSSGSAGHFPAVGAGAQALGTSVSGLGGPRKTSC